MIGVLFALGTVATCAKGADFGTRVIERATGIPINTGPRAMIDEAFRQSREMVVAGGDLLVEGFGDTVAAVLDPLHLFTDNPADQRDAARKQARKEKQAKEQAQSQAAQQAAQQQDALAQTQAALADAEARAAAAQRDAETAKTEAARAKKAQKAKAARGFAGLSRNLAARSQSAAASGDQNQALTLAQQALAMAMAAMKPPTDAREQLRSTDDPATKQLKVDTINAINRDGGDADFDSIADRLTSSDPEERRGAERDYLDQAELMGHDAHSCGGECDACAGLDWKSSKPAVPELAGGDTTQALSWESRTRREELAPIVDEDLVARSLTYASPSCVTGSCGVPRR